MAATPNPAMPEDNALSDVLSPGTPLFHGQYTIESFLSSGGFGITYLARDSLDRLVVVKECFPHALCMRNEQMVVSRPRSPREDFHSIVKLFVQEARNLARLKHPNIVGVHQIFEDNGTAYMALDYIRGRELLEAIEDGGIGQTPKETQALLQTMLETVSFIHGQGVLHRDISPDNILIREDNTPVLIDFGAARAGAKLSESTRTQILAVKDGYSPQEFYISGSVQSPASDLYALAATFYHLITGEAPPNSDERLAAAAERRPDPLVPITERAKGYDRRFLEAIDKALKVFAKDRFQAAIEWEAYVNDFEIPKPDISMSVALARRSEAMENASKSDGPERPEAPARPPVTPHLKVVTAGDVARAEEAEPTGEPIAPETVRLATEDRTVEATQSQTKSLEPAATSVASPATAEKAASGGKAGHPVGFLLGGVASLAIVAGAWFFMSGDAAGPDAERTEVAALEEATPLPVTETRAVTVPAPEQATTAVVSAEAAPEIAPAPSGLAEIEPEAFDASRPVDFGAPPKGVIGALAPGAPDKTVTADTATPTYRAVAARMPARVDESAPASAAAPTGGVLEATAVMSGWTAQLPFTLVDGTAEIDAVHSGAPVWMRSGQTIRSVDGTRVSSSEDIRRAILAMGEPGPDGTWRVAIGIVELGSPDVLVRTAEIGASHQTGLLNGLRFESLPIAGEWQTVVAESPFSDPDAPREGDVLIAYLQTNETLEGPTVLPELLEREVGAGRTTFGFAVRRDGALWVVSMDYGAGINN